MIKDVYRYRVVPLAVVRGQSVAFDTPVRYVSSKDSQNAYRAMLNDGFRLCAVDGDVVVFEKTFKVKERNNADGIPFD